MRCQTWHGHRNSQAEYNAVPKMARAPQSYIYSPLAKHSEFHLEKKSWIYFEYFTISGFTRTRVPRTILYYELEQLRHRI